MVTPKTIKWIYILVAIRLGLFLLLFSIGAYIVYAQPTEGFLAGFADALFENSTKDTYNLAFLLGKNTFAIIFTITIFLCTKMKAKIPMYVFVGLDILFSLGNGPLPIFPAAILILSLQKTSKDYFSGTGQENL